MPPPPPLPPAFPSPSPSSRPAHAPQLDHILGRYGTFIVERAGADMDQATEAEALARWRHNIFFVAQLIQNDVSSTKVRLFLRRGLSVRYLVPAPVVAYIEEHALYLDEGGAGAGAGGQQGQGQDKGDKDKGKGKEKERQWGRKDSTPTTTTPTTTTTTATA